MVTPLTSYDSVLYPGYTHPQTHPSRLEVMARLFGLDAPAARGARVLEIGCGSGSNLVPLAWALPDCELVGIDLAARPVARGSAMIQDLALTNVRLVHGNITEINASWGKFDYIIAHGFYSWVPPEIQERLLALCRLALAPHGVAFVSYNALPGCQLRTMLRDMMLFHVRDLTAPRERIEQALALARFLADAQDTQDEFRIWMRAELHRILEHAEGHLYHDELAERNEPLYFREFMQRAAGHGLQFLGEADFFEMSDHIFKESVRGTLGQLARNRILREQYLDFLKCRRFRQTLLCHRELTLREAPHAGPIANFLIASAAKCSSSARELMPPNYQTGDSVPYPTGQVIDLRTGVTCAFEAPKGGRFETDYPLGKAALGVLGGVWPRPVPFGELLERSLALLREAATGLDLSADQGPRLCEFLLELYGAAMVDFRTVAPRMVDCASEHPLASPVARWQVRREDFVTSALHVAVQIEDEVGRSLLSWLDGTNDRTALLEKLWELLRAHNALPEGDEASARRELASQLEANLAKLARLGLLVG